VPGVYQVYAKVAAFRAAGPTGAGYALEATVRTTGAATTLIGTVDKIVNEEAGMTGLDATIVVSGNDYIVQVTGAGGLSINWKADLEFTFVS
jgi:hypothetical protein